MQSRPAGRQSPPVFMLMDHSHAAGAKQTATRNSTARRQVVLYVARRFGVYLFTLWAAITVAFFIFRAIPGDPMMIMFGQLSRAQGNISCLLYTSRCV